MHQIRHTESLASIAPALVQVQAAVRPALKDSNNPHLRTRYADLNSVMDACREALGEHDVFLSQHVLVDEPDWVALETMLLHKSGEYLVSRARIPVSVGKGTSTAQAIGSAITYLRRYTLAAVLGIVADDDDDGHAATQARRQPQPPPQAERLEKAAGHIAGMLNRLAGVQEAMNAEARYPNWRSDLAHATSLYKELKRVSA